MKVSVFNMVGDEVSSVELPTPIFEAQVNRDLMHQALVRQLANARRGTHKTKGRSEINRTTRKMYRQKGTGNARHGSRRAPIFVGGGVAHGPTPRSYAKNMPRKMRQAALRSALSVKAGSGDIVVLDEVKLDAPKTRRIMEIVNNLVDGDSTLLLLAGPDDNVEKSARNISNVKTLRANYLNIRDLLGFDKIVMPLAALEVIDGYLNPADDSAWVEISDEEE